MYSYRYDKPRLTGVIVKEAIKCGKPGCKCASGKLHRWYYYLYYREWNGHRWRLKKEYVPRTKVKALRRKIKRWKVRDRDQKRYDELTDRFVDILISGCKGYPGALSKYMRKQEDFEWMLRRAKRRRDMKDVDDFLKFSERLTGGEECGII